MFSRVCNKILIVRQCNNKWLFSNWFLLYVSASNFLAIKCVFAYGSEPYTKAAKKITIDEASRGDWKRVLSVWITLKRIPSSERYRTMPTKVSCSHDKADLSLMVDSFRLE